MISLINEQLVSKCQSANEWEDYLNSMSLRAGISNGMLPQTLLYKIIIKNNNAPGANEGLYLHESHTGKCLN